MIRRALTCLAVIACVAAPAAADEVALPFQAWGKLKLKRGADVGELEHVDRSGDRPRKVKTPIAVAEDAAWFADRAIPLEALSEGAEVWVYGEPKEHTDQTSEGRLVTTYQVVGVQLIVTGEGVHLEAADAKATGPRWLRATVIRTGWISLDGNEHKLVCERNHGVLLRGALEGRPKKLKSSQLVAVVAEGDGVETPRLARQLTLLDRRLRGFYPLLTR